jgi:hypothetical protein
MEAKGQSKTPLLVTLSSLIGVLLGATLQYFITLETQEARLWAELRTKAYISYLENTARLLVLEDKAKLEEARALRNSARFSIALYGSRRVVEKMAAYGPLEEKASGSKEFEKASVELFDAMRNDLLPRRERASDLFYPILFPSKVSK